MARATQSAFVNPAAIRGDVHAECHFFYLFLHLLFTAILGTANVKINSYGNRFPPDRTVFSFKDWLCFDQLQPQFRLFFFKLHSLLWKLLSSFSTCNYWYYCILSAMHSCAHAHVCVCVCEILFPSCSLYVCEWHSDFTKSHTNTHTHARTHSLSLTHSLTHPLSFQNLPIPRNGQICWFRVISCRFRGISCRFRQIDRFCKLLRKVTIF